MDDIPWHLVAIVFITFAIWIRDRVREAADWRRQKKAEMKAKELSRRSGKPSPTPPSPYLNEYPEYQEEEKIPEHKSFRELFEEIQERVESNVEPDPSPQELYEQATKEPPPLPGEVATVEYAEIDPTIPTAPLKVRRSTRRSDRKATDPLSGILKDREKLRTAILLKEILDKPVALREESSF